MCFFFKQKTAYEMRISDWSSDVCSSDLDENLRRRAIDDPAVIPDLVEELLRRYAFVATPRYVVQDTLLEGAQLRAGDCILAPLPQIGRASCRERVCQYV